MHSVLVVLMISLFTLCSVSSEADGREETPQLFSERDGTGW